MRQSAQQAETSIAWKQEVNRRVAQHQGRRAKVTSGQALSDESTLKPVLERPSSKAAARAATIAAARVAERYAKAPSYSEMMVREALAAMRQAGVDRNAFSSTQKCDVVSADLEMSHAVSAVFDPTSAPNSFSSPREPQFLEPVHSVASVSASHELVEAHARINQSIPAPSAAVEPPALARASTLKKSADLPPAKPSTSQRPFEIRWDADLPVRASAPANLRTSHENSIYEVEVEAVSRIRVGERGSYDLPEMVEPAQPIHANLIHFPRELVAANRARPRRAEGAIATLDDVQLSIFEAELGTTKVAQQVAKPAVKESAPTWVGLDLPRVKQPDEPIAEAPRSSPAAAITQGPEPVQQLGAHVAPINRRILAGIVDFSLVTGAFLTGALLGTLNATVLPPLGEMEIGSLVALVLVAVFYHALFFGLSRATPGMQYAGLELCTFNGKRPRLGRRFTRAAAMVVSLIPLGLGAAWALFDDQQLSWHDRLSSTYLRKA